MITSTQSETLNPETINPKLSKRRSLLPILRATAPERKNREVHIQEAKLRIGSAFGSKGLVFRDFVFWSLVFKGLRV